MPTSRKSETREQRNERHERQAQAKVEDAAAADAAVDDRIRRNIQLYGP